MADLSQTAANVSAGSSAKVSGLLQAGEAITAGSPVYKKSSDSKYYNAIDTSQAAADSTGIALSAAPAADDYFIAVTAGPMDVGATLTVGETYVVSAAGKIAPVGDLTTNDWVTILGQATAAAVLEVKRVVTDTQHA